MTKHERYNRSEKGRARNRRYAVSEKARARNARYEQTPRRLCSNRTRSILSSRNRYAIPKDCDPETWTSDLAAHAFALKAEYLERRDAEQDLFEEELAAKVRELRKTGNFDEATAFQFFDDEISSLWKDKPSCS
jgi:hypothetical protein